MKGYGQRISTPQDFPNLAVYVRNGPVYTVAFKNRESVAGMNVRAFTGLMVIVAAIFGGAWLLVPLVPAAGRAGIEWYWVVGGWIVLSGLAVWWGVRPRRLFRAIELDFDREQFRVYCEGKLKLTRPLTALSNLTVDDHPQAENERQTKRGEVGQFGKQHCLYGWFGPGGANKTLLFCRWEWPSQERTLFEVQQALIWAIGQQTAAVTQTMQAGPEGQPLAARPGLAPPLD